MGHKLSVIPKCGNAPLQSNLKKTPDYSGSSNQTSPKAGKSTSFIDPIESTVDYPEPPKTLYVGQINGDAPNGGYGWIVVLGCFITHTVFGGIERSEGIFFLEFKEKFGRSAQLTSLPGALVTGIRLFVGPVAGALSYRYSVRLTCLLGSLLLFFGMILNAFITDFNWLFLSHAVIQGIGRGFLYTPSLIIVADYFDKKRGIANGLSTSGTGIGTFILAPLQQFLFDVYGYTGAFLVIAAISLNTAISAMLYKPLIPKRDSLDNAKSSCVSGSIQRVQSEPFSEAIQKVSLDGFGYKDSAMLIAYSSDSSLGTVRQLLYSSDDKIRSRGNHRVCEIDDVKVESKPSQISQKKKIKVKKYSKHLSVNLMKQSPFVMFCISLTLFTAASKTAFTFMPALITSKGYTQTQAAWVLSITGAVDIIGRIGAGLLFDHVQSRLIRPIICNVFIYVLAVVIAVLPLLDGFAGISVICAVNSILTGAYVSQKTVISMDVLGPCNISRSIGLLVFFQGFGVSAGVPLMAALGDKTNSYNSSFFVCGALMIAAGFFMTLSNIYIRSQERENGTCA